MGKLVYRCIRADPARKERSKPFGNLKPLDHSNRKERHETPKGSKKRKKVWKEVPGAIIHTEEGIFT
jgi:hypothetical protein